MASRTEIGNGDEAAATMRRATSKLGKDLSRTAHDAGAAAAELATVVQHSAAEIGERTAEFGKRAAASARGAAEDVHRVVREHPIASVVAAAGAGTLVGFLLARRR